MPVCPAMWNTRRGRCPAPTGYTRLMLNRRNVFRRLTAVRSLIPRVRFGLASRSLLENLDIQLQRANEAYMQLREEIFANIALSLDLCDPRCRDYYFDQVADLSELEGYARTRDEVQSLIFSPTRDFYPQPDQILAEPIDGPLFWVEPIMPNARRNWEGRPEE